MDPSPVLDHAPAECRHAGLLTILQAIAVPNRLGPICSGSIAPGCFASVGKYKARPGDARLARTGYGPPPNLAEGTDLETGDHLRYSSGVLGNPRFARARSACATATQVPGGEDLG